jgi:hypothetical protein
MGEEKFYSLYLQLKDTSSHGPSTYRMVTKESTDNEAGTIRDVSRKFLFPL